MDKVVGLLFLVFLINFFAAIAAGVFIVLLLAWLFGYFINPKDGGHDACDSPPRG